jgi:hypothetical protein
MATRMIGTNGHRSFYFSSETACPCIGSRSKKAMTKLRAYSRQEIILVKTVKVNWVLLAEILRISLAQFAPEEKRLLKLSLFFDLSATPF